MKKSPPKSPAKRVKTKSKRVVKQTARRAVKLTQAKATKALAELKGAIGTLKAKGGSAKIKAARVEKAFVHATKLNRLVKKMKSSGLI
jgi:hypothetical protein